MRIKNLPWNFIRSSVYTFRRVFGTKEVPERDHLLVESTVGELEDIFRSEHFRTGWFLSYHYKGEDGNYCRAEFGQEGQEDMQLHIRVFDKGGGECLLYAHYETDPVEHPRTHLRGENESVSNGIRMVKDILDDYDIVYTGKHTK